MTISSKAVALVSGGLDSLLAVKLVQKQGIFVQGIFFETPFFSDKKVRYFCDRYNIPLKVIPVFDEYKRMLLSPASGYGRHMNPCIDCHGFMFRKAADYMKENGFHFLISGEVLGERPMSQNRNSLDRVAKLSSVPAFVLRPLSAKCLPPTEPELKGLIKRENLESIKGRGRLRQYELAKEFGIDEIPQPGGGCLLTDKNISERLRFLISVKKDSFSEKDARLLKAGRHLHLGGGQLLIVGRNESDNETLTENYDKERDILFTVESHPGPVALLVDGGKREDLVGFCASACARYSDISGDETAVVSVSTPLKNFEARAGKAKDEDLRKYFELKI